VAASKVYLQGGPCNGRLVSANAIVGGLVAYIKCGGGYYTVDPQGRRHNGHLIFDYAGKEKPGPPGGVLGSDSAALRGWGDLRRQVNTGLPSALNRADRLSQDALRRLRRRRRVRG
jgi:hypothetical protein